MRRSVEHVNAEFIWASVGVGVLLAGVGAALLLSRLPVALATTVPSRTRSTLPMLLTRSAGGPRHQEFTLRVFGAIFLVGCFLLLALTGLQVWLYSQASAGTTNREFQDIALRPTAGTQFDEAAFAFVHSVRAPFGYDIDTVTFTAVREQPTCDVRLTSCAPDPASAPAQEWDGTLNWKERRDAGSWRDRSCEALAILTVARGWRIEGSRWCTLLPKST